MKIPYGVSSFPEVREMGGFYADKTPLLYKLEDESLGSRYPLFLRPRRMGKSLLISMLECYYDRSFADRFDTLFEGLAVHQDPTRGHNQYLVWALDFSPVQSGTGLEDFRASFLSTVKSSPSVFIHRNLPFLPELSRVRSALQDFTEGASIAEAICAAVQNTGCKIYVLIDEYDAFANDLLAHNDLDTYEKAVEETGFVRAF